MTRPRISVIIPCFNSASFLHESLGSVVAQSQPVDEIIVIDDASTDEPADIARRFGAICITLKQNAGPGAARNRGIAVATGDLVAFLDADDYWTPTHIAEVAALLDQYPESAVAFSRIRRFGGEDSVSPSSLPNGKPSRLYWRLIEENLVAQSTAVVRRRVLDERGGYDESRRYSEDYELWLRLARHHSFVCTNDVTAGYRVHPLQASSNIEQMLSGRWHVKHSLWREAIAMESQPFVDVLERCMLHAWNATLEKAWWERDERQFRIALELHELVPRSDASHRRWVQRHRYGWSAWLAFARMWERLPESTRAVARPALTAVLGPMRGNGSGVADYPRSDELSEF